MRSRLLMISSACLLLAGTFPPRAADFSEASPDFPVRPSEPSRATAVSFETGPDFDAADKSPSEPAGTLANVYGKLGISHVFGSGWELGGSFQSQVNIESDGGDTYRYYAEAHLGYKLKLDTAFTLTPSAAIGEVWGHTGITPANPSALYYAFYLAGDWRLSPRWTWNVFDARYRNAFDFTWVTPKIATGITYEINSQNSISTSVGYSWKDSGKGLKPDEISANLGYKYAF